MKWKILLLIAVISAAAYANSFRNSFHFDDQHFIVENPYIQDLRNIPSFFFSSEHSSFEKVFTSHYRPLLVTSYAINYAIGGLRPEGYHVVNLMFHIGSAFLIYLILQVMLFTKDGRNPADQNVFLNLFQDLKQCLFRRSRNKFGMTVGPVTSYPLPATVIALTAAFVFVVHPFNSEVVNYITARSSVMCAFFYLLSFYCWIRFRHVELPFAVNSAITAVGWAPPTQKDGDGLQALDGGQCPPYASLLPATVLYIFSLIAFVLAMLTKEIAITLPAALILYDIYFHKRQTGVFRHDSPPSSSFSCYQLRTTRCLPYVPFILLIIVPYLLYRISVYGSIVGGTRNYASNLFTQPAVLLKYIRLMFVPTGLTIEHDIRLAGTFWDTAVVLSIASLLIILCIAYLLFRPGREWKVLSFFILWFFITLLPTTIIPLNAVLQENRGYLAGIVAVVVAGICISKLRRRLMFPVLALLVIVFFILTVQRNLAWKDDLSLWSDAVAKAPMSARAHDNLGLAWMGVKKYDMAIEEFNKTLKLNHNYYLAYYNAGVAYQLQGDLEKAKFAYEKSLKINPLYFRSYYNIGIVYKRLGELDMAVSSYDKAIAIDPRHPFVYNNLGVVLTEQGDYKRAEGVFKKAVAMNPNYEKAYYNLGNVYFRDREYGKAAEAYRAAVRIRPDYREADEMLRETLARL